MVFGFQFARLNTHPPLYLSMSVRVRCALHDFNAQRGGEESPETCMLQWLLLFTGSVLI